MQPLYFAAIRQVAAGLILVGVVLLFQQRQFPPKNIIIKHALAGILLITLGNGLVSYGETIVSSGLTAVIVASTPLWIAIVNEFRPGEQRLSFTGYCAIILGLLGICGIFSNSLQGNYKTGWAIGALCILIATFAWVWGSVIVEKKSKGYNTFALSGIQMLSGGIVLMIASLFLETNHEVSLNMSGLISLIFLILIGSIVAMVAYTYAISHLPLQLVSNYAFINPLIALLAGWVFLNEELSNKTIIFSLLIIISVIILNLKVSKRLNGLKK